MGTYINAVLFVLALAALVAGELMGVEYSPLVQGALAAIVGWTLKSPGALAEKVKG